MRDWIFAATFLCVAVGASVAQVEADTGFEKVTSEANFKSLVTGKALTRLGISLDVKPTGQIEGRAFGREVTGAWRWDGSYFCRTLNYGSQQLEANCQEVKVRGDTLRFTSDQGSGDSADLRLR